MAQCNYQNCWKGAESCEPAMAGTGDKAFFANKTEWLKAIVAAAKQGDSNITKGSLPRPGYEGVYGNKADSATEDAEVKAKMALLKGSLVGADIKPGTGHVTSSKGAENDANQQQVEFTIDGNIKAWNELAKSLGLTDFAAFIPNPSVDGEYYVVMSPTNKTTIENAYDSGTTWDSDHGFNATVSAAPSKYAVAFWNPGEDLETWCKE